MSESDKTPQRAVMHFCFQLGKSPLETVELMNRACSERKNRRLVNNTGNLGVLGEEMCRLETSKGPKDGRSEENVKLVSDVVNENRRVTVRSLCETLN